MFKVMLQKVFSMKNLRQQAIRMVEANAMLYGGLWISEVDAQVQCIWFE